jgi:signal transduction histidine kinase
MIRALVELSRVSRNAEPVTEVDLNELMGHFQKSMAAKLQLRDAHLEVGDMPVVTGQPSLLATLWRALLENSLEHTGNGPVCIQTGCLAADSQVECWVQDDGPGIYPSYQDQIFHIFKKAGSSGEGVGAGLAIAKAIVEKHGGAIWINTETKSGVGIHFTLPR